MDINALEGQAQPNIDKISPIVGIVIYSLHVNIITISTGRGGIVHIVSMKTITPDTPLLNSVTSADNSIAMIVDVIAVVNPIINEFLRATGTRSARFCPVSVVPNRY
jgi:hypothetical protein